MMMMMMSITWTSDVRMMCGSQVLSYTFMMPVFWMLTGWLRMLHMIHTASCVLIVLLVLCGFIFLTNLLQTTLLVR